MLGLQKRIMNVEFCALEAYKAASLWRAVIHEEIGRGDLQSYEVCALQKCSWYAPKHI